MPPYFAGHATLSIPPADLRISDRLIMYRIGRSAQGDLALYAPGKISLRERFTHAIFMHAFYDDYNFD